MADLNKTDIDQSYVQVASGSEPTKKKSPIIIAIVSILLLLVAAFLVYWFVPVVNNSVNMAIMKPEDYFAKVHKDTMKEQAVEISESYDKIISKLDLKKGYALEGGMNFDVDQDFAKEVGFEEIKSVGATCNYSIKDTVLGYKIGIKVNDVAIANTKAIVDIKDKNLFLQIPELTESYIKTPIKNTEISNQDLEMVENGLNDITSFIQDNPLTAVKLEDSLNKYTKILVENIANVELEKGVTGDASGIGYKYNVLTATLNEKEFGDKLIEVLEAAKEDTVIKDVVIKAQAVSEDDYTSKIDEMIKSIKDTEVSEANNVVYKAYVDSKGIIRGINFKINAENSESEEYSFITAVEDKQIGMTFKSDNDTSAVMNIVVTQNGNKCSATATMLQDDKTTMNIDLSDFEIIDQEKGYANGVMKVSMPEETDITGFTATLSSDGSQQNISYVFDGEEIGLSKMDIYFKTAEVEDIALPSESDKVYDVNDTNDMQSYQKEIDYTKFVDETGKKIGIDDLMQRISNLILGSSASNSIDDDYTATDNYYTEDIPTIDDSMNTDDTIDDEENIYNTDLSVMSVKLKGKDISSTTPIGDSINELGLSIAQDTMIAPDDYDFYNNADNTVSVMLENQTTADAKLADCCLIGISLYDNTSALDVSVNGITFGSTVADIEKAFNVKVTDPNSYSIYIVDENDSWKEVDLGITDGKVTSIDVYL